MMTTRNRLASKNKKKNRSNKANMRVEIQRYMRRNAEHKFFDSTVASAVGTGYNILALSQPIIQGVGGGARVGDNITYIDLTMIYRIDIGNGSNTDVRFIVVLDKQNNGVAPVVGDLLVNTGFTSTYSAQQIKEKRFNILWDVVYNVTSGGVGGITKKVVIPLVQKAEFNDPTNVVGANGKNSMWLFMVSTDNTNKPGFNMDFQIRFTDF